MNSTTSANETERAPVGFRASLRVWLLAVLSSGCTWLPHEFNLSPIYRHRLDAEGEVLELDVMWPIVHYERTPAGGDDFRIRPFYRRVTEPEALDAELTPLDGMPTAGVAATEHQFLWPIGRVRADDEEVSSRVFPLWWHRARTDDLGLRETDWYLLFPFFWGGSREDGQENYFGFFPIYADLPDFLTYERFHAVLWPLYLGLQKQGWKSHILLWPFAGFGSGPEGHFHRFLPVYSYSSTSEWLRTSVLWPFFSWGIERRDTADPIRRFFLWPLFGRQWSDGEGADAVGRVSAWTFLWPFFQRLTIGDRLDKLDVLWPLFRFYEDRAEGSRLWQWWLFPLIARTITDDQWAWNFLWPLIWIREYADPDGSRQRQRFFVPFWSSVERELADGRKDDYAQLWPVWHHDSDRLGRSQWSVPSIWPYRAGNAYGFAEAYDWMWTIAKGRQRALDDRSVEWIGNLYTSRRRGETVQASVPFLFNYEADAEGGVLRLLQFIPIPWRSSTSAMTTPVER